MNLFSQPPFQTRSNLSAWETQTASLQVGPDTSGTPRDMSPAGDQLVGELEPVFFVVLFHEPDEGALVACRPARVVLTNPGAKLLMESVEVPTSVVCAEIGEGFISEVISRF